MSKDRSFEAVSGRCAWTPSTEVQVLLGYIYQQQSNEAFEDYLAEIEAMESDPEPGVSAPCPGCGRIARLVDNEIDCSGCNSIYPLDWSQEEAE